MTPGNYSIKVIGTLPGLVSNYSAVFELKITPFESPYFLQEQPKYQKVFINTELLYTLPPIKDP